MSNITNITYFVQPQFFPPGTQQMLITPTPQAQILSYWIGLETGGTISIPQGGGTVKQTLFQIVNAAIQSQVRASQNTGSALNSLDWGDTSKITYIGTFTPAPQEVILNPTLDPAAGGTLAVALTVPGNSLAFTVDTTSNPKFTVTFDLVVTLTMTFPVCIEYTFVPPLPPPSGLPTALAWQVAASAAAQVEVHTVSTNNELVQVCKPSELNTIVDAINGYLVKIPDASSAFSQLNGLVYLTATQAGQTQLLQEDDGNGNLQLTVAGPKLGINGGANDTIRLNTDSGGDGYDYFQVYSDHVAFTAGPTIDFQPATVFLHLQNLRGGTDTVLHGVTALTVYGSTTGNNIQTESVGTNTKVTLWGTAGDVLAGAALASVLSHQIYTPTKLRPPVLTPP